MMKLMLLSKKPNSIIVIITFFRNSRARAEGGAKGDPPKNELKITLF